MTENTSKNPYSIKNIRLFIAFRIFFNARFYYPVFTILFLDYGLTLEQFSLLNTVWAVTIVFAEVPSGALADLLGRRYLIITTSVLMILEMLVIALVPLGNGSLIFWAFLFNRILSGLAEAMASGADEAIAYDSLVAEGNPDDWPRVLSLQMRLRSVVSVITMTIGALVYDPKMVNIFFGWLGLDLVFDQQTTMRFPIYLTLILAVFAAVSAPQMVEKGAGLKEQRTTFIAVMQKTYQAASWVMRTPFALAVILFSMCYDHILRMIVTLTSQYFRLISLPEASFGLIGSAMGLLGIIAPKIAEKMVIRYSAQTNMLWLALLSLLGLVGLTFFIPYFGLLPMALIFAGLMLVSFFTSHYLNQITDSSQRATVLSIKGLALNLGYGLIGFLFALLIANLREAGRLADPGLSETALENLAFTQGISWFPGYTLVWLFCLLLFSAYSLKGSSAHKRKG